MRRAAVRSWPKMLPSTPSVTTRIRQGAPTSWKVWTRMRMLLMVRVLSAPSALAFRLRMTGSRFMCTETSGSWIVSSQELPAYSCPFWMMVKSPPWPSMSQRYAVPSKSAHSITKNSDSSVFRRSGDVLRKAIFCTV